jgi:hypothetical protein
MKTHPSAKPDTELFRRVIETSEWLAIATSGKGGPHQAACWSRNVVTLGFTEEEILVPVWRMQQTECNLLIDSRIELLFVSAQIQREKGTGQGLTVIGTGSIQRMGACFEKAKDSLNWIQSVLCYINP